MGSEAEGFVNTLPFGRVAAKKLQDQGPIHGAQRDQPGFPLTSSLDPSSFCPIHLGSSSRDRFALNTKVNPRP